MNSKEKGNAQRFIDAFRRIERTLKEVLDSDPNTDYRNLISEAAKINYGPVGTYQQRLHRFGYLRNAILHNPESSDSEVIARPRTDVVEEIEQIADIIESPPTIAGIYRDSVYSVVGNKLVSTVAHEMKKKDFSQAPVTTYDSEFRTLLTTNSIARWFAEATRQNLELDGTTVDNVLDHREEEESCAILSPDDSLFDLVDVFNADTDDHIPPYAAVVTRDGKSTGELEGILTPFDLPDAYDQIAPSHR